MVLRLRLHRVVQMAMFRLKQLIRATYHSTCCATIPQRTWDRTEIHPMSLIATAAIADCATSKRTTAPIKTTTMTTHAHACALKQIMIVTSVLCAPKPINISPCHWIQPLYTRTRTNINPNYDTEANAKTECCGVNSY